MSSKLNLFFAHGDNDHVVEYGYKFNGDFIMIEKFNSHTEHIQEPYEIPSVDWEVEIIIKKEDLIINQIEDHKDLISDRKEFDFKERIETFFSEARKQEMYDEYYSYHAFRQIQKNKDTSFISNEFEDIIQLYGVNYTKELTHLDRNFRYKEPYMIDGFEN